MLQALNNQSLPKKSFFTQVPSSLQRTLNCTEYKVYSALVDLSDENGICSNCIYDYMEISGLCEKTIRKTLKDLANKKLECYSRKPLIILMSKKSDRGDNETTSIQLVDIWKENEEFFRNLAKQGRNLYKRKRLNTYKSQKVQKFSSQENTYYKFDKCTNEGGNINHSTPPLPLIGGVEFGSTDQCHLVPQDSTLEDTSILERKPEIIGGVEFGSTPIYNIYIQDNIYKQDREVESIRRLKLKKLACEKKIVVVPSLNKLNICTNLKQKISEKHSEEEINLFVNRVLAWEGRKNDEAALNHVINSRNDWNDKKPKEKLEEENKNFLDKIRKYDTKVIANTRIDVYDNRVEFVGSGVTPKFDIFTTDDNNFEKKVRDHFENLVKIHKELKIKC